MAVTVRNPYGDDFFFFHPCYQSTSPNGDEDEQREERRRGESPTEQWEPRLAADQREERRRVKTPPELREPRLAVRASRSVVKLLPLVPFFGRFSDLPPLFGGLAPFYLLRYIK